MLCDDLGEWDGEGRGARERGDVCIIIVVLNPVFYFIF